MANIAIVIPAYNAADTIGDALGSVFSQTRADFEVIVVDDGSSDGIAAAVAPWRNRVRLLRQENAGPGAARNAGIAASDSPLLAFLDADDRWHPQMLERLAAVLERSPGVDLVCSDFALEKRDGPSIPSYFRAGGFDPTSAASFRAMVRKCFVATSAAVVRRSTLARTGGFHGSLRSREDFSLWLRIARHGRIEFVPEVLVTCRSSAKQFRCHAEEGVRALSTILEEHSDLPGGDTRPMRQDRAELQYRLGILDWKNGDAVSAAQKLRDSLSVVDRRWAVRAANFALVRLTQAARGRNSAGEDHPRAGRIANLGRKYRNVAKTLLFRNQDRRWQRAAQDPCPAWDERNRMIASLIQPQSSVLDLGCGAQTLRTYLPAGCSYQPCDLIAATPQVAVYDFNAGQYPHPPQPYGFVVCSGVLEYVRDAGAFLRNIAGSGECIIVSYNTRDQGESKLNRLAQNWVNHYSQEELEALFASCGLDCELVRTHRRRELIYRLRRIEPVPTGAGIRRHSSQ